MEYRCEATSVEGFVQMLASNYLPHGYYFYITGVIPSGKDPASVDQKLIDKYNIRLTRQQRARRKLQGFANLHYIRFENFFVVLATHGKHEFFEVEAKSIRDIRKTPLRFRGYSFSVRRGGYLRKGEGEELATVDHRNRVRVLIAREEYRGFVAQLLEMCTHRTSEKLQWAFWNQPYEPYAPIRKQLLRVLRIVNQKRTAMGYEKVPTDCIRYRRAIVKPFEVRVETQKAA